MPSRRKGLYTDALSAEQEMRVEHNIQALLLPQRARVADLPIEHIQPNPFQARRSFDGIEELAEAIRVQGFITRLRVRPDPAAAGRYQLVYGERRLRAAQLAGLATVPVEIVDVTDEALVEVGLAENIQRRDLNPLEEAHALQSFINQRGYTQAKLAERIGKPRSYVQERLSLLDAPADVQEMIRQRPDTVRVAREIARLPTDAARRPLIEAVLEGYLSKDAVSTLIRDGSNAGRPTTGQPPDTHGAPPARSPQVSDKSARFDRALDHDIPALQVIFSRWRQAARHLSEPQRERLLAYVEQHLEELEQLMELLRK